MTIRHAEIRDLPAVQEIKNYYIKNSMAHWAVDEISRNEMLAWWSKHGEARTPIIVAESDDGEIMGYSSLSKFRSWPGYRYSTEISIYLMPQYHGLGIGSKLMQTIIDLAVLADVRCITSWIDGENEKSVRFHERFGFLSSGCIKGCGEKWGKKRDVIIMQLNFDKKQNY